MAGAIQRWRMPCLRSIDRPMRRARLLAARQYPPCTISRKGILGGYWDGGSIVRAHMKDSKNG